MNLTTICMYLLLLLLLYVFLFFIIYYGLITQKVSQILLVVKFCGMLI